MKHIRTVIFAVTAAMLVPGCKMTEDYRNCPDTDNVRFNFSLLDEKGAEVFRENIRRTDLILFDAQRQFYAYLPVATADMNGGTSISMSLDPGEYILVAWGNLNGRAGLSDVGSINSTDDGGVIFTSSENGDPLYYAASPESGLTRASRALNPGKKLLTFTVPKKGEISETISFTHAHKRLDVYVKGYKDQGGGNPIVQTGNLYRGYDLYLNHLDGGLITFRQQAVDTATEDGTLANAEFYISRINEDNNVTIEIQNPVTGATEHSVVLNDVIGSFKDFDLSVEVTIPIMFEFFEGRVEVKMPEWYTSSVKPGLD